MNLVDDSIRAAMASGWSKGWSCAVEVAAVHRATKIGLCGAGARYLYRRALLSVDKSGERRSAGSSGSPVICVFGERDTLSAHYSLSALCQNYVDILQPSF